MRILCAVLAALLTVALGPALADESFPAPSDGVVVGTFAGTGVSGNHDGPLASATFASPAGLAVGSRGEIYVVDKALNTLRVIENGAVRTLVGSEGGDPVWRAGAYRDGPLGTAAFNHPEGVAVAPDGSIIVADTLNLSIRRVKDGVVSTIAGSPEHYGAQDGPAASATFKAPVGVAVDRGGSIYVADSADAVRVISVAGIVRTLPIPGIGDLSGVAIGGGSNPKLYIADETGLVIWDIGKDAEEHRYSSARPLRSFEVWGEAHVPIGMPYALAADGRDGVAFTDISDDSIHRMNGYYARGLAGGNAFDPNFAGGYADGSGTVARFFGPLGIVKVTAGWIVSDSGNHRLRTISSVDDRQSVLNDGVGMKQYYSGRRPAVALVGNSQLWFDSDFASSVPGRLKARMPGFDVLPFAVPGANQPGPVGEYCSTMLVPLEKLTAIAYVFNDSGIVEDTHEGYDKLRADDAWMSALAGQFARAKAALGPAASRVFVVYMPTGYETSPNETPLVQQIESNRATLQYGDITAVHAKVAQVIAASGFENFDAWPTFRDADRLGQGPLFGPFDAHLSPKGRALLTRFIFEALRKRNVVH